MISTRVTAAVAALTVLDVRHYSPSPKGMSFSARNVSSIVNRLPWSVIMSCAFRFSSEVARHHDSFLPLACATTTAGIAVRSDVTRTLRSIFARPLPNRPPLAR